MHLTLIPYISTAGEIKTADPALRQGTALDRHPAGRALCRCRDPLPPEQRRKIALFTNVEERAVFSAVDADDIYKIPHLLHEQSLDAIVCEKLGIDVPAADLREWQHVVTAKSNPDLSVTVAMVGKYVNLRDSYISLSEALMHAGLRTRTRVKIDFIEAQDLEKHGTDALGGADAILVPGGFGERGIDGKIEAVPAREHGIPYLGICLGMQLAIVEYARNVAGLKQHGVQPCGPASVIALITGGRPKGTVEARSRRRISGERCGLVRRRSGSRTGRSRMRCTART